MKSGVEMTIDPCWFSVGGLSLRLLLFRRRSRGRSSVGDGRGPLLTYRIGMHVAQLGSFVRWAADWLVVSYIWGAKKALYCLVRHKQCSLTRSARLQKMIVCLETMSSDPSLQAHKLTLPTFAS